MYRVWGGGAFVHNAAYNKLDTADLDEAWLPLIDRGSEGRGEREGSEDDDEEEEEDSNNGSDNESNCNDDGDYDLDSDSIGSISNSNCSSNRSNNGDIISINPLLMHPHRRDSGGSRGNRGSRGSSDDTDSTPTIVQGISTALRPSIQRSRNRSNSALSQVSSLDGNTDQNTRMRRNSGIRSGSFIADPGSKPESSTGMHVPSSSSSSNRNRSSLSQSRSRSQSQSQSRANSIAMREYQQRLHGSTIRESRSGSGSDTLNTVARARAAVSSFISPSSSSSAVRVDKDREVYKSIINYRIRSGKSKYRHFHTMFLCSILLFYVFIIFIVVVIFLFSFICLLFALFCVIIFSHYLYLLITLRETEEG